MEEFAVPRQEEHFVARWRTAIAEPSPELKLRTRAKAPRTGWGNNVRTTVVFFMIVWPLLVGTRRNLWEETLAACLYKCNARAKVMEAAVIPLSL